MTLRFAFAGFRHGHVKSLYRLVQERPDTEVVSACEDHDPTRAELADDGLVSLTHRTLEEMLERVDFDVLAVGDYYARRGPMLIKALEAGKHVIADKPMCTRLDELDRIEELARSKDLAAWCMLSFRDGPNLATLRRLVRGGTIGSVVAVSFGGQHPLNYGRRPGWYFEKGKHGGTINDIAIHAIDAIPWITGLGFTEVTAARNWNGVLKEVPHFRDSAQVMMQLDGGVGVLGDVSYLAPNSLGYSFPLYWRMTFWGTEGVLETSVPSKGVTVYRNGAAAPSVEPPDDGTPGGYLESMIGWINHRRDGLHLTMDEVLHASRVTLVAQQAADRGDTGVEIART